MRFAFSRTLGFTFVVTLVFLSPEVDSFLPRSSLMHLTSQSPEVRKRHCDDIIENFLSYHASRDINNSVLFTNPNPFRWGKRRTTGELNPEQAAKLAEWIIRYCQISTLRRVYGRNKNGDLGDWPARLTRRFYNFKIKQAMDALEAIGLPDHILGNFASKSRDVIKQYCNERSLFVVRAPIKLWEGWRTLKKSGIFDPNGLPYEFRVQEVTNEVKEELEQEGIKNASEEEIGTRVSLKLLEKARKPNEGVNWLANLNPNSYILDTIEEAWSKAIIEADQQRLEAYQDIIALFLLDRSNVPKIVPSCCKSYLRSAFPICHVQLRGGFMSRNDAG